MVRIIYASVVLVAFTNVVQSQFYDFFSAFQPVHQTLRPFEFDVTTKRPKTTSSRHRTTSGLIFDEETREREKQRQKERNIYSTASPLRRTSQRDKIRKTERPGKDQGRLVYDDGKTNVIDYEKPGHRKPVTSRPGVRPAVANGPPITNKPPTLGQRLDVDVTVSPDLILGPDEDYMSSVEKKRYIEMAEKMCDRYKALDTKQVAAIPLLPSPDVTRLNVSTCTPSSVPLVVGGKVVTVQEFPHMALLGWPTLQNDGFSWKCGGSLVSDRYVLTAAHCAYQERDTSVVTGAPRVVQLGSSYMDGQNAVLMKVTTVVRHPKYKLPKSYYDLALVKMDRAVTFSSRIKPACLGVPPPPGDTVIATGWGRTEFGDQSQELRSVSVPIWNMNDCYNALGTSRKIPDGPSSESQICAAEKSGGRDTCQGDSGGPAQIQDGCVWRVVAVTSIGRSCGAAQTPALYAKVQRAFISAVVFDNNKPTNQDNNKPSRTTRNYDSIVYNDNRNRNDNQNPRTESTYNNNNDRSQYDNNNQNLRNNNRYTQVPYNRNNERNENNYNQNTRNNNNAYTTEAPYNRNNQRNDNDNLYNNQNSRNNNGYTTESVYNNARNQNSRFNNNAYTTTAYNKPRNYYNDYSNTDYQSNGNYYNSGRAWWT